MLVDDHNYSTQYIGEYSNPIVRLGFTSLPKNGWFIVDNSTKMDDDWGYPLFQETTKWDSLSHGEVQCFFSRSGSIIVISHGDSQ